MKVGETAQAKNSPAANYRVILHNCFLTHFVIQQDGRGMNWECSAIRTIVLLTELTLHDLQHQQAYRLS